MANSDARFGQPNTSVPLSRQFHISVPQLLYLRDGNSTTSLELILTLLVVIVDGGPGGFGVLMLVLLVMVGAGAAGVLMLLVMVIVGGGPGARGGGEPQLHGYKVSIWEDREVLEMDGGDACTTM